MPSTETLERSLGEFPVSREEGIGPEPSGNEYHIVIQKFPRVPVSGLVEIELPEGEGLHVPIIAANNGNGNGDRPKQICVPVAIGPVKHTYA